jgi:hypothetical protein
MDLLNVNLYAAWVGMFLGGLAGAGLGLFFHREEWLGGYASWPRRMLRLGHISLFGIAFLNLAFALTAGALAVERGLAWPSRLLLLGAVTMPLVCGLSAWRKPFRHLFFLPALSVIAGIGLFLRGILP